MRANVFVYGLVALGLKITKREGVARISAEILEHSLNDMNYIRCCAFVILN